MTKIFRKLVLFSVVFMCAAWSNPSTEQLEHHESNNIYEEILPLDLPDQH